MSVPGLMANGASWRAAGRPARSLLAAASIRTSLVPRTSLRSLTSSYPTSHVSTRPVSPLRLSNTPVSSNSAASLAHPSLSNNRLFSSTSKMAASTSFLDAVVARHSIYGLKDTDLPINDDRIEEILKISLDNVPSSFNAQSTRIVLLLKDEHKKFWDYVLEVLQPFIKPETKAYTEGRITGFRSGYGSVLFFEDPNPVNELKKKFPQYEDRFEPWAEHTSAMHQFVIWTALGAEGLGANLQHYNPLIDAKAKDEWKVPGEWSLKAQLVFGAKADPKDPDPKPKLPTSEKLFVHGK